MTLQSMLKNIPKEATNPLQDILLQNIFKTMSDGLLSNNIQISYTKISLQSKASQVPKIILPIVIMTMFQSNCQPKSASRTVSKCLHNAALRFCPNNAFKNALSACCNKPSKYASRGLNISTFLSK